MPDGIIEVTTSLPLTDYRDELALIEATLVGTDCFIDLSASSVIRTKINKLYSDWFDAECDEWGVHFAYAEGVSGAPVCCGAHELGEDLILRWWFADDDHNDKGLALRMKLTFGGNA